MTHFGNSKRMAESSCHEQSEYIITDDVIHGILFRLQKEGWRPNEAWLNQTLRSCQHIEVLAEQPEEHLQLKGQDVLSRLKDIYEGAPDSESFVYDAGLYIEELEKLCLKQQQTGNEGPDLSNLTLRERINFLRRG